MPIKRRTLLMLATVAGSAALLTGATSNVLAASPDSPKDTLVEKIATKFNLNKDEVQKVFEEEHQARKAEMQQKNEERLNQAVSDGKLTQAQKDLIVTKQKELHSKMEEAREKNQDLKQLKSETREELEKWAEDNDIDLKWLHPIKGKGPGHPGGMRGEHVK